MFKTLTLTTLAVALMFAIAPAQAGTGDNGARLNGTRMNGGIFNGFKLNGSGENGVRANGEAHKGTASIGQSMETPTTPRIIAVELPATR